MKAFLKSLDEKVQLSVETGWEKFATSLAQWIDAQKEATSYDSKEPVGSCQIYESKLPKTNKSKSLALKSVDDVDDSVLDNEISSTEIAYLTKKFRNFLKITIKMQETKALLTIRM